MVAKKLGRERLEAAIKAGGGNGHAGEDRETSVLKLVKEVKAGAGSGKEAKILDACAENLKKSMTLHVAADAAKYQDGLLRFIGE